MGGEVGGWFVGWGVIISLWMVKNRSGGCQSTTASKQAPRTRTLEVDGGVDEGPKEGDADGAEGLDGAVGEPPWFS